MPENYAVKFSLAGRLCAVTGGAGLIGSRICACLADLGADVLVADVDRERAEAVCADIAARTGRADAARFARFDQTGLAAIGAAVDELERTFGPLWGWVNNAYPRTGDYGARLEDVTPADWEANLSMLLSGYCLCANAAARRMAGRGGGAIVNMGSIQSLVAPEFSVYEGTEMTSPAVYTAAKGGILMYTKYLASYYGASGVRVNCVCPGGVANNQPEPFTGRYNARTPLRRMADPAEIAPAVAFLLADASSYVTGAALAVDGGLTAV
ncbi:MAG: SDR family oxidoreductase [Desulfovibrionaceae bacterium]|jgi:NAD(P)-dependent dehydrogenase (short-subunit alcohol dehydrogenase family)|nr:SDR family oxidoreductase [Desulfovibrionaceae bacterium]